jgi:hypothetical protein
VNERFPGRRAAGPACAIGHGASFDGILSFWGLARVEGSCAVRSCRRNTRGRTEAACARIEVDVLVVEVSSQAKSCARAGRSAATGRHHRRGVRTPRLVLARAAASKGGSRWERRRGPPRRPRPPLRPHEKRLFGPLQSLKRSRSL